MLQDFFTSKKGDIMENISKERNNSFKDVKSKKKIKTSTLVKVALLSAISFILMFIEMPIPIFPSFLKIDISDIPALVAGLTLGPIAGVFVEFVKNILHLITSTSTGGVGELANVIVGGSFVLTASVIYRKNKTKASLFKGFALATIVMALVGSIVNYFFLLPFYGQLMGMDAIIGMGKAVNPKVTDLLSFVLWFIAPFNILKGCVLSILSIPVFKKLESVLREK